MASCLRYYISLYLLYLFFVGAAVGGDDFYETLGVPRDANNGEIRRAYRTLAKEWHPDRNADPEAQAEFIKITEAYETLSDDQRRVDYDRYGHSRPNNLNRREQQYYRNSELSFFDGMPFQFQSNWKHKDFITSNYYKKTILYESFTRPYLIQVVSDWCLECAYVEDIWTFSAKELGSLGLGTARVNRNMDPGLVAGLGVRHWPSFVGVISGKRYHFGGEASVEKLREFVDNLFSKDLVVEVTHATINTFLRQWYDDNKPRGILFTTKKWPPLLQKMAAFKYQQYVASGFVQSTTMPGNGDLLARYGCAGAQEPCFVVFKENTTKPELVLSGSALKSGALSQAISQNLYLNFPRLSKQMVFDDLCPIGGAQSSRSLCVIYFTDDKPKFLKRHALLRLSKDAEWVGRRTRFVYVKKSGQQAFESALKMNEKTRSVCPSKKMANKVAIVWRVKKQVVKYTWLENGWCTSNDVAKLITLLGRIHSREFKLELSATVPNLDNEEENIAKRVSQYWSDMKYYTFHYVNWSQTLSSLSLILTLAFVFLASYLIPNQSESNNKNEDESKTCDENTVYGLVQLNSSNQNRLLKEKNGQTRLLIVLLSDASSKIDAKRSPLIEAFANIAKVYNKDPIFQFGWLSLPNHIVWCNEVMQVQTFGEIKPGTVLALNGPRKYLSIFKITREQETALDDNLFEDTEDEDIAGSSLFQEDRRTEKSLAPALVKQLPRWLEKLYEGMLPRVKLEKWPAMESDTS